MFLPAIVAESLRHKQYPLYDIFLDTDNSVDNSVKYNKVSKPLSVINYQIQKWPNHISVWNNFLEATESLIERF